MKAAHHAFHLYPYHSAPYLFVALVPGHVPRTHGAHTVTPDACVNLHMKNSRLYGHDPPPFFCRCNYEIFYLDHGLGRFLKYEVHPHVMPGRAWSSV